MEFVELLQGLTSMGFPPLTVAVLILLHKQDKRLSVLEALASKR